MVGANEFGTKKNLTRGHPTQQRYTTTIKKTNTQSEFW